MFFGSLDFESGRVQTQRARSGLNLTHFQRRRGIFDIGHDCQSA